MRCLIANDEQLVLMGLSAQLKSCGFQVTEAINGHEAFEKFRDNIGTFQLVILDL